jgi:hypothetical protein
MSSNKLYQLISIYPKTARIVLNGIYNNYKTPQDLAINFSTKNLIMIRDYSKSENPFKYINWDLSQLSRYIYHEQLNRAITEANNNTKYEIPFYSIMAIRDDLKLNSFITKKTSYNDHSL